MRRGRRRPASPGVKTQRRKRAGQPALFLVLESTIAVETQTEQPAPAPRVSRRRRDRPGTLSLIGLILVLVFFAWLGYNLQNDPTDFFNIFLIGLTQGSVYALVALGYT